MKTQKVFFKLILLIIVVSVATISCSKEGPINVNEGELENGTGITEEDLEPYQGDIGIVIDARKIAKKGYKPVKVMLDIDANSGDYSQTIDLNEFALMGQILLPVKDLSAAALEELQDGVQVVATVLDESGSTIWSESLSKLSFQSNPLPNTIQGNNLEDLNTDVQLISDTPYYIQLMENGVPLARASKKTTDPNTVSSNRITVGSGVNFTGDEDNFLFYFEAIPGKSNHFKIKHKGTGDYLGMEPSNVWEIIPTVPVVRTGNNVQSSTRDLEFIIRKENNGEYIITDTQNRTVRIASGVGWVLTSSNNESASFRFVPMNIDWKIENISGGTEFLQPVLPAATTKFAFNSTLINCGQGPLEQSIESAEAKTTTTTIGWEESVSIASSHTAGVSVGMGMEVSGSFFGNGATYSAEVSASYDYTNTNTTTNTNWKEAVGTSTRTHLTTRTVTVPAKTAVLVYDVFQSYVGVKVNIVRRLRVKANEHDSGVPLTGEQISTQFHFNGFQGHVNEIGADYVEITLRGVATMDEIFESQSDVQEVDPMCSN